MAGEVKNIIKVSSIYMATVIGAGFASGQEIFQFFSVYYKGGFYGIVMAGVLFSVIGYIVLDKVYRERIKNYDEFLFPMLGWFAGWVMEIAVSLFMLSVFSVMIAGLGNILSDKLSMSFICSTVLMTFICMLIILNDIKGIVTLSTVITPLMVAGLLIVGLYIIVFKDTSVFKAAMQIENITHNWAFSSLLYVGYNSLLSVVVMCSLLPYLKTRRIGKIGGVLGGMMLCFVALVLNTVLFLFYSDSKAVELPMLEIVEKYSGLISGFYAFILWLAMLISAVTSGLCFAERVSSKTGLNIKLVTVASCILVIPLSGVGFSGLISAIYPVFGYAGLFLVFAILLQSIRRIPFYLFRHRKKKLKN